MPRISFYNVRNLLGILYKLAHSSIFFFFLLVLNMCYLQASKAALISFFETLRTEIGSNIGITIVTPGLIDSEITRGPSIQEVGC